MARIVKHGPPEPPDSGEGVESLLGFLDYKRATLAWKSEGLDAPGAALAMMLGGMLKHLALVEEGWLSRSLLDRSLGALWDRVDRQHDPDWDWHSARLDSPRSYARFGKMPCRRGARRWPWRSPKTAPAASPGAAVPTPSLRWILCHLIEE